MAGYNNSITDINSKVGIGTGQTEPASKLEVNTSVDDDGIMLDGTQTNTRLVIKNSSAPTTRRGMSFTNNSGVPGLILQRLNDDLTFSSNLVHFTTDAKVGIGVTNPGYSLQIGANGSSGNNMMIEGTWDNVSVASNSRLNFNDPNFGIGAGQYADAASHDALCLWAYAGAGRGMLFSHTTAGATQTIQSMRHDMFIDGGTGNIGINNVDPITNLHIQSGNLTTNFTEVIKLSNTVGVGGGPSVFFKTSGADNVGRYGVKLGAVRSDSDNGSSVFKIQQELDDGSGNLLGLQDVFTIDQYGRAGIGTTTPMEDLDIVSDDPTLLLRFDGAVNGANSGRIKFSEGGTNHVGHMEIHYDGAANKMYFNSPIDSATGLMTIERTGDVGINTTAPTAKLHIANTTTWGEMSNPIINIQNNGTGGDINTAHNMGSITWKSGTVSTAEIKAVRNTPASGDNVELRFSTSAAGVQGERMTINNNGIVFINNSLGVNVTSITTGYKLVVGGGDISANQAVAKISLGQIGSQGDAYFGASGLGSPTVGSQDYGFYSAHNAYRTATGAWKHSRADAIGAVRILGSGGGSSGNAGFSFDYSANNGTNDITWTNLMQLSTGGNLQLPQYGSGILVSDGNGTITSSNSPSISGDITMGDNLINYKFTSLENTATQYWLLCFNAGANDVNGTLIGDRSSGHHQAMNLDIVISAKSASMQTGMLTTKQVLEYNEKYTLVTLTYNTVSYVAIKYEGHPYPITGNGYFTGLLKSTIGTNFLLALNASQVSSVAAFSNLNTKATIQAAKVGIGTADPGAQLQVEGTATGDDTPQLIVASGGVDNNAIIHFTDDEGSQVNAIGALEGNILTLASQNELVFKTGTSSILGNTDTRMIIETEGNVGIGTTSPGALLDVDGDIRADRFVDRGSPSSYYMDLAGTSKTNHLKVNSTFGSLNFSASNYGYILEQSTTKANPVTFRFDNDSYRIYSGSDGEALTVLRNKKVGIIQTNPTYNLDVTGDGRFTSTVTATNFVLSSDERLKENIEKVCDNIVEVDWKTFELKTEKGQKRYGVIAQELEKTNPEFVREDTQGFKSVAYIDLLIAKIAELEARLEKAGI